MWKRFATRDALAIATCCVAVLLVALGAGTHDRSGRLSLTHGEIVVGVVALSCVALTVIVALLVRKVRTPGWRIVLVALAIAGVLACIVWFISSRAGTVALPDNARATSLPPVTGGAAVSTSSGRGTGNSLLAIPLIIAAALVVMLVVAAGYALRGRRRTSTLDDEDAATVVSYAAIDAADEAMRDIDDPRQSIIACYSAMERTLALGGVRRLASETPTDLVARLAARAGLNGPASATQTNDAARRLTALFLEARFSSHPMSTTDRDAARSALALLRSPVAVGSA